MAKKTTQPVTLREKYNGILERMYNTTLDDCIVFRVDFPTEARQHSFHFAIMKQVAYRLYDGTGAHANIIMAKDATSAQLAAYTAEFEGTITTLTL